ncbi:hypothetical protein L7F22_004128 [Adiantum nelumboides]|nr:hypothetical protein [Adiantum nelumboides]
MLGTQPAIEVIAKGELVTILNHEMGTRTEQCMEDPMKAPSEIALNWKAAAIEGLPNIFCGGWVGFFSYDTVRYTEKKKLPVEKAPLDDRSLPDIHLGLYKDVVVFDHVSKIVFILHWVCTDHFASLEDAYDNGQKQLDGMVARLQSINMPKLSPGSIDMSIGKYGSAIKQSNMTKDEYIAAIHKAKDHILAGDIFQIVLSQRFERRTYADPFEVYRALRVVNPSPYMIYLQARGCILVASSPEILTRINKWMAQLISELDTPVSALSPATDKGKRPISGRVVQTRGGHSKRTKVSRDSAADLSSLPFSQSHDTRSLRTQTSSHTSPTPITTATGPTMVSSAPQATPQMTSPIGTVGSAPSTIVHHTGLTAATIINMAPSTSTPTPRTSAPQGITHYMSRANKLLQMEHNATLSIADAINSLHGAQKMHAVTYESMYEELLDTHERVYDRDVEKAAFFDRNRILNMQVKDLKEDISSLNLQLREAREQLQQKSVVTTMVCDRCAQMELTVTTPTPSSMPLPPHAVFTCPLPGRPFAGASTYAASMPATPFVSSSAPIQPNPALYSSHFGTLPQYHVPLPTPHHLPSPSQALVSSSAPLRPNPALTHLILGKIINRPLAGTRRRGKNREEDLRLEDELLKDEKECAEHVMLVDLGRNDVGKVAKAGSVRVERLMDVERTLEKSLLSMEAISFHADACISQVSGEIQDNLTSWDVLQAALPVGTVSGAPKVRAMELIDELEKTRRGPYSGGIGGISFTGDMDIALALRTMVFPTSARYDTMYTYGDSHNRREWVVHLQAGAGIVADSNPEDEYNECVNKAAGLGRAIDLAESAFLPPYSYRNSQ